MDPVARIFSGISLAVALVSIGLTLYLWYRSGPILVVTLGAHFASGRIRIRVANIGRLPVALNRVELRDHLVMTTSQGQKTNPVARWVIGASSQEAARALPFTLPPTESSEFWVDVAGPIAKADGAPDVVVTAWAQRGDGKWASSKELKLET